MSTNITTDYYRGIEYEKHEVRDVKTIVLAKIGNVHVKIIESEDSVSEEEIEDAIDDGIETFGSDSDSEQKFPTSPGQGVPGIDPLPDTDPGPVPETDPRWPNSPIWNSRTWSKEEVNRKI